MRRLYFVNRFYWPDESATAQMLCDLAEHMAKMNCEVTVLTSRQLLENPDSDLAASATQANVTICRLATTRFGRHRGLALRGLDFLSFYGSLFVALCIRLRRGDVVVTLTDPPLVSVVVAVACSIRQARSINWLQDLYPEVAWQLGVMSERGLLARGLRHLRDWALRHAAQNIAIGEQMAQRIRAAGAPAQIIHNWSRDIERNAQATTENRYRTATGCGASLLLCYSGNLGRAHRFESLLQSSMQLQREYPHHVLIIGGGHQFSQVQQQAQGLSHWTFMPPQPRKLLGESLSAADVHIVSLEPALEGLIVPSKIYGVLAAGRACIFLGDPSGEVANILRRHDCGWAVHPDDTDGLSALLRQLVHARELLMQKGENARRAFEQSYAPHWALQRWQTVVSEVDRL